MIAEEPLKIAVCEDREAEAKKLVSVLDRSAIPTVSKVFPSGEALLREYCPQQFDLLLMDIYMTGITGIEAVARIRETDETVPVAFITTSLEHTLESYRLSALKYIEKPFKQKDIDDILLLAKLKKDNLPSFTIRQNGKEKRLPVSRTAYLEQQMHRVYFYLTDGSVIQIYGKLSSFSPLLEKYGFFIPHKSFAVNLACALYIDDELKCFVMQNGKNIPIRRECMKTAKKALEKFLFERARGFTV